MTIAEIDKIRVFLAKVNYANNFGKMQELVSAITAFFGERFGTRLKINTFNVAEYYSKEYENLDKIAIRNFLESLIAQDENATIVINILELVAEGEFSKGTRSLMGSFISKAYYSYSDKISFDEVTVAVATASREVLESGVLKASEEMVYGVIAKLKSYATEITRLKQINTNPVRTNPEINFQPYINVETRNETVITIDVAFENARQKIADEGFSDVQTQELLGKLAELKEIAESRESKGSRWAKAKEIMKWLIEQGIAAAGILMPVLSEAIK